MDCLCPVLYCKVVIYALALMPFIGPCANPWACVLLWMDRWCDACA